MVSELTRLERREFEQCEQAIERGLQSIMEMGFALRKVRDKRWYWETHATFEDYCGDRWRMSRRFVNRIIEAAQVIENLGPVGPKNIAERQARPLSRLEPEQQREAYARATETAPNGHATAAHVQATVNEMFPPAPKQLTPEEQSQRLLDWLHQQTESWTLCWVSFDRMVERAGGFEQLMCGMSVDQIEHWAELLEHFVERSQTFISLLKEQLR